MLVLSSLSEVYLKNIKRDFENSNFQDRKTNKCSLLVGRSVVAG